MANPSPQHNPTDGIGTAVKIALSGTGLVTIVAAREYSVPLSLTGTTTVAVTATVQDAAGTTFSSGNSNVVTWVSYETGVATVDSSGNVTAVAKGQAVIEAQFPSFDTTDGVDKIYVQLLVSVGA